MRRFAALLTVLASLVPLLASAQSIQPPMNSHWAWHLVSMRNTSASAIAREPNWAKGVGGLGTSGTTTPGFLDSTVLRRAANTLTIYDTTQAIPIGQLPFPAHLVTGGGLAASDTSGVNPWIGIRVSQDTLSYSYASVSAFDSIYVAAQWSLDGANWNAVAGTPTVQPAAAFFTSGEDGIAPLGIKAGELTGPASDVAQYVLSCVPILYVQDPSAALIFNKTLCEAPGYIRFIIAVHGTGQFRVDIARWDNIE